MIVTTQTPSGSAGTDKPDTEDQLEEDVDNADTDDGTPRLVEEDDVDIIQPDSETPRLAADNDVIEADIADIGVEENIGIEKVWELPGGWFYFGKPSASSLYQTVQTFPAWKSGYQRMPWLYPRRWPVRPLLTNEVGGDDTGAYNTKLSPSYPFYAFRKTSH